MARNIGMRASALLLAGLLAGCAAQPGPSVPVQPGKSLATARAALQYCEAEGPAGSDNALAASYVTGILFGGVLLGPIVVASNASDIRYGGALQAVDNCLKRQGYTRRDLTVEEVQALNGMDRHGREQLLDHLVGGGTLATFRMQ